MENFFIQMACATKASSKTVLDMDMVFYASMQLRSIEVSGRTMRCQAKVS